MLMMYLGLALANRYTMSQPHLTPSGTATPRTLGIALRDQLPYSRPSTPHAHGYVLGFIGLVSLENSPIYQLIQLFSV